MKMLLRQINLTELNDLFTRCSDLSPAPHLTAKAGEPAVRNAKRNGVWEELNQLDPAAPIPVLKRSHYRNFERKGDRKLSEIPCRARKKELKRAAMALWLGHPNADLDYLQDLMWAYCDDWTWVMAAHERCAIDLGSAATGADLAELLFIFGEYIEEEVRERVLSAIEKNIFEPFCDYRTTDWWKTAKMNWNHVCNGEIIRTALYLITDPAVLTHMIHPAIQNMTYALDGFTDDGGCEEGPGYWAYGFGHYMQTAYALFCKTNGELNIMEDCSGKIERICRYPLAAHIKGRFRSSFADSMHGFIPAFTALLANKFYDLPELCSLCELHPDNKIRLHSMHELALYDDFEVNPDPDHKDYFLPELGMAKLRGKPGQNQMALLCIGGNNGVPHNHNDIGSFIVHKNGFLPLVDPGAPVYTRKTFSPERYDIIFCHSFGHSVPVINGKGQPAGKEYFGRIRTENLNGKGIKKAVIDMTNAYDDESLLKLERSFLLDTAGNVLFIEDVFDFQSPPESVEEAFITFENATVAENAVKIGPDTCQAELSCVNAHGTFQAVAMPEESKDGKANGLLTRIQFIPDVMSKQVKLRFRLT